MSLYWNLIKNSNELKKEKEGSILLSLHLSLLSVAVKSNYFCLYLKSFFPPCSTWFYRHGEDVSGRQTFNKSNGEEKEPFFLVYFGASLIFFYTNAVSSMSMKTKPDAPSFFLIPPIIRPTAKGKQTYMSYVFVMLLGPLRQDVVFSCPLALKESNRTSWFCSLLGSLPGDLPSPTALEESGPVRAGCPAPAHDNQSESSAAATPAMPLPSQRPGGRQPSYKPLLRLWLHRQGQLPVQRTRRPVHPVTRFPTQPAKVRKHGAWLFLFFCPARRRTFMSTLPAPSVVRASV